MMLTELKEAMNRDLVYNDLMEAAAEAMAENDDDDIRDAMLDNPEDVVDGVENDPEIKKLVDMIPEAEEEKDVTAKEIEKITESLLMESIVHEEDIEDFYPNGDPDKIGVLTEECDDDDYITESDVEGADEDGEDDDDEDHITESDVEDDDEGYITEADIEDVYPNGDPKNDGVLTEEDEENIDDDDDYITESDVEGADEDGEDDDDDDDEPTEEGYEFDDFDDFE